MGVGLLAGVVLGLIPGAGVAAPTVRPVGTLFLNLLSMVVVPLVATALFAGIAKLGRLRAVGRLVARTLAFFWATSVVAIVIGFGVGAAILPLGRLTPEKQATLREAAVTDSTFIHQAAEGIPGGARFIVDLIPANPVRAAAEGNLLPVIVFVTFLGLAVAALPPDKRAALTDLADVATDALIRLVHWVLLLAPFGIFALVFPIVARFGWDLVKAMLAFIAAVIVGELVLIAAAYLPMTPRGFLRAAFPSMLMGFSTTSSLAALPTMLQAADKDLRLPRAISGFALPLGASINRAGSALYQAIAVLFVAQLFGVTLGFAGLLQAALAVFLASLTVASVPSASVVSLLPAFTTIGLPIQGLSILIGLDRIPDMFRTMANVTGHLTGASVVARLEREPAPAP